MSDTSLRSTFFGGYKKEDVIHCMEKIKEECDELRKNTAEKIRISQKEYDKLEAKHQELIMENSRLRKKCEDFQNDKNSIVEIELQANARAKQIIQEAEQKAEDILNAAKVYLDCLVDQ